MNPETQSSSAIASVVIPAHNEESVIGRCLTRLLADARPGELEVIVVCNGCQDRTAQTARSFGAVQVAETPTASKVAALNLGDQLATRFPRLYLDSDVDLATESVRQLVAALEEPGVLLAEPKVALDVSGVSPLIQAHSRTVLRLADETGVPVGTGVLALSEVGRRRFSSFPDIAAEDLFVRNLFGPDERVIVKAATCTVRPPRTLRSFVRVTSRIVTGNRRYWRTDLPRFRKTRSSRIPSLVALARRPAGWADAAAYVGLVAAARLNAVWGRLRHRAEAWERDETSRSTTAQDG